MAGASIVVCASVAADCRLVVGPSGCDDVVVDVGVVGGGKEETQLVLGLGWRVNEVDLSVVVPRLQRGSEVVPLLL